MLEQSNLVEEFSSLLDMERQAQQAYSDMAARVPQGPIRQQLEQLIRDKQKHVKLIERLLEILQ